MKSKNTTIALLITLMLLGIPFAHVIAGASFDWGDLAPKPGQPVPGPGEANWIAWTNQSIISDNIPYEILTEDNVNSDLGENVGYSEYGDREPNMEWWIQVEHFYFPPRNSPFSDPVYMIFGGLSSNYKGTLWRTQYPWIITESDTYHGTTPIFTTEAPACPSLLDSIVGETTTLVRFWGQPGASYHVYRSRNESGAFNGKSNGQYFYLATLTADQSGNFQYTDDVTELNWYIAVQADPTTNTPIGCHSEPVSPTAVEVTDFTAAYQFETNDVKLSWTTVIETDILGFNLYRSEGVSGERVKINAEPIPAAHPGSLDGATYPQVDANVQNGLTYHYWLEVLKTSGTSYTLQSNAVPVGIMRIYVPFIRR